MTKNQIEYLKLKETERANRAREAIDTGQLSESERHNKASEQLTLGQNVEQARHNVESERQNQVSLDEASRHNRAYESIQLMNADTSRLVAQEQQRHNLRTESETQRSNLASEAIRRTEAGIKAQQLAEAISKNDRDYTMAIANLRETARSNQAREQTNQYSAQSNALNTAARNAEQAEHNDVTEQLEKRKRTIETVHEITNVGDTIGRWILKIIG